MKAAKRQSSSVIVSRGLWKGFDVIVEPPSAGHPLRHFKVRDDAQAYADELARLQGWPVHDRTGEAGS